MEKCRWFGDHRAGMSMTIDDLSFAAFFENGNLVPWNDWGYGLREQHSLYAYVEDNFLSRYPEAQGTIFFPLDIHHGLLSAQSGYDIRFREERALQIDFLRYISPVFELAFHGTTHGRYLDITTPVCARNNWLQEFEYLDLSDVPRLQEYIEAFESEFGIEMTGGKCPGYATNDCSAQIICLLGFRWWMLSARMCGHYAEEHGHSYIDQGQHVIDLPTNISGGMFACKGQQGFHKGWKDAFLRKMPQFARLRDFRFYGEEYLAWLYENGYLLSVQEHFVNLRPDGKRQTPNLFDDIDSLSRIYSYFRGADIWHAKLSEVAHYLESYDHSELTQLANGYYSLTYHGSWDEMLLSVRSRCRALREVSSGRVFEGRYKQGWWVYDKIPAGEYSEVN